MKNSVFILILFLSIVATTFVIVSGYKVLFKYETSRDSRYCYTSSNAHGNIEYKEFFRTLEACGKPFKK